MPVSGIYAERLPWSYPTPFWGRQRDMSPSQKIRNILYRRGVLPVALRPKHLGAPSYKVKELFEDIRANPVGKKASIVNPSGRHSQYADGAAAVLAHSVFGIEYPFPNIPGNLKMLGAFIPPDTGTEATHRDPPPWLAT